MLGALAGDLFRYSVASFLIIVLGVILGFRPAAGPLGVLLAFLLVLVFAFAVSWLDHLRHEGEESRIRDDDQLLVLDASHLR